MSITVQIVGADASDIYRAFDLLEARLNDTALAGYLKSTMEPFIQQRAKSRFANEGDDASGPWLPLASATENIRASLGYGPDHPINKRTGLLEQYITSTAGNVQPTAGGIEMVYPGTAATGELYQKVSTAQSGKPAPKTDPRAVLAVNQTDMAFFQTSLATFIQNG